MLFIVMALQVELIRLHLAAVSLCEVLSKVRPECRVIMVMDTWVPCSLDDNAVVLNLI